MSNMSTRYYMNIAKETYMVPLLIARIDPEAKCLRYIDEKEGLPYL